MPAPTVTAVTPNFGTLNGGVSLTLTGTNFTGATGVTIGGVAATALVVVNSTTITITSPAGSAGTASIVVTNPSGANAGNSLFFYVGAGVPADTFIYLKGGRGDGYVPLWTGLYQDALVDENSEPYRDIFPSASDLRYTPSGIGESTQIYKSSTSLIYTNPIIEPAEGSNLRGTVDSSTSDEINHEPPRQYVRKCTWRFYLSADGKYYHYRLIDILGTGSKSRDF